MACLVVLLVLMLAFAHQATGNSLYWFSIESIFCAQFALLAVWLVARRLYFRNIVLKSIPPRSLLMAITITRSDPRYAMLHRSRNLRWDGNAAEAAAEIELCETAEQAAEALQRAVTAGMRPTVRSGGHCYEDFVVNNPGGVILDLSLLKSDALPGDGTRTASAPGKQLGEAYIDLYKRHGVTIPGRQLLRGGRRRAYHRGRLRGALAVAWAHHRLAFGGGNPHRR